MYKLQKENLKNRDIKKNLSSLSLFFFLFSSLSFSLCMCYCCSQSDVQSTFSNNTTTTTTTDNTNPESDTNSDSNSDQKSKPWLSRMFASSDKSDTNVDPSASATTADGKFNAKKHFDLKNVSHDFNKPAGIAAAPGVRLSKTGRKIRWEGPRIHPAKNNYKLYQNWTQLRVKLNYLCLTLLLLLSLYLTTTTI